ncbi:MAG: hypothetical protein ACRDBZ_06445, partial [Citrobacter braakii]
MAIEFALDEKGSPQKDPVTGLFMVNKNGAQEPLDLEKLFNGIAISNNDAADKRRKLEAVQAELSTTKTELDAMRAEIEAMKSGGKGNDSKDPKEMEWERRLKSLEESNAKKDEENKRLKMEQEQ